MKKIFGAALTAAALTVAPLAANAQTLVFGEPGPNRGARAGSMAWLNEQIREKTDLEVQEQWAGALFGAPGALDAIGNGVADFGTVIAAYFPTEMTGYSVADLPLGYTDPWVLIQATDQLMRTNKDIIRQLENLNLKYVGPQTTTGLDVGCKGKRIETLADLEGVSMRVVGVYGRAIGDLYGVTPVNESIYNAYQSLDTGLYDCTMGYAYITSSLRWTEQFTSYTKMSWGQIGGVGVFMNLDTYEGLSDEQKAVIDSAGSEMGRWFSERIQGDTVAAFDEMKAAGIEVLSLSDEERAKLIADSAPYLKEWVERADKSGLDGDAILTEYRALLEKFEAEVQANGYPWES